MDTTYIKFRITEAKKRQLKVEAARRGLSLAELLREKIEYAKNNGRKSQSNLGE